MPILDSVRNMLTRRRADHESDDAPLSRSSGAVDTDIAGTQAERLFQVLQQSEDVRRSTQPDHDAAPKRPQRIGSMIESKPLRKPSPSSSHLESADVVAMVHRIGQHLDDQRGSTERLLTLMERLPTALGALPEMNRHCNRLLETVTEAQQQARRRDESLNQSLTRIGVASERHTEVLGLLQQQLDANGRTSERITETLDSFRLVLSDMSSSTSQQVDVLSRMARASEKRELRITATLARTQKWMIAAMIFCGGVTLAALGVAVVTLLRAGT